MKTVFKEPSGLKGMNMILKGRRIDWKIFQGLSSNKGLIN